MTTNDSVQHFKTGGSSDSMGNDRATGLSGATAGIGKAADWSVDSDSSLLRELSINWDFRGIPELNSVLSE
jgi:hypothetical protein